MNYRTIIGLEIHVELMTKSKLFCSCSTRFDSEVNTNCCPVCLGLPGALPVLNKKVVEFAMMAGTALNCEISNRIKMDRKNYFYPDLVKGYQITQYHHPICQNGTLTLDNGDMKRKIRIERIHIEEDTGKTVYADDNTWLLDYNRSGVPLIEIVTKPDLKNPREVKAFLEKLKRLLEYIGISDCKMEEGSLRCDVNINVEDIEKQRTTAVTEVKNLNSFKSVTEAIIYEEKRHQFILKKGKTTLRETRKWDEEKKVTVLMRAKEAISDYRYFPDSDIVTTDIDEKWLRTVENHLPELPDKRQDRFISKYGIPQYDADILCRTKGLADYYEETVNYSGKPKVVSNWMIRDLLGYLNNEGQKIEGIKVLPKDLAMLIELITEGKLSNSIGQIVFKRMLKTGKSPDRIVKEQNLEQITDEGYLEKVVKETLRQEKDSIESYRNGKEKVLDYLVGQVMKTTKGRAEPKIVNQMILKTVKEED